LNTRYEKEGYLHLEGYVSEDIINRIAPEALEIRYNAHNLSTWKGVSCASRFNKTLDEFYTSDLMTGLARKFLDDDFYYFNDQVVYKLPFEHDFIFEEHYDNQYGPNIDNKIHTVNFCVILDDFAVSLDVRGSNGWVSLYPKKGDIVAIRGDTYHRSQGNSTDKPRGLYACVYTKEPLQLDGFFSKKVLPKQ
jgi:hypothetical protein